jgi:hypothetical protein
MNAAIFHQLISRSGKNFWLELLERLTVKNQSSNSPWFSILKHSGL